MARLCDVADYEAVAALATGVELEIGPVAVLVNNAGVIQFGDFLDHAIEDGRWIRSGVAPEELLRSVGDLCAGAEEAARQRARRMVGVLLDGLAVHPAP